jgi:hypothetical protein
VSDTDNAARVHPFRRWNTVAEAIPSFICKLPALGLQSPSVNAMRGSGASQEKGPCVLEERSTLFRSVEAL